MALRKKLGEKLAILAKSQNKTQADIAERSGMAPSQLNRFFRGHSDLTSENLESVLLELGIDLEEIISNKTRKFAQLEKNKIETKIDCLRFLFESIDELGQQTYLKQLAWVASATSKKSLPEDVRQILNREIKLI